MIVALRRRIGARWSAVALLIPPALFGVAYFGPRAGIVLAVAVGSCLIASVASRALDGLEYRWLNPGTLITGLLLGLTVTPDIPLYMLIVGAVVAEIPAKWAWPKLGRNLLNPAITGRAVVALLETIDPVRAEVDMVTGASVLAKGAGGQLPPAVFDVFVGLTRGSIGETSALILVAVAVVMLVVVVPKREAALSMIITVPVVVAVLPITTQIAGHAPWMLDPLVHLIGSAVLLNAAFFATDPVTTPRTRIGGVVFGVGAAVLGVTGRLYTDIPGVEMYGILAMNVAVPLLDRLGRVREVESVQPVADFYDVSDRSRASSIPLSGDVTELACNTSCAMFTHLEKVGDDRDAFIREVAASGLGGCGGAWFPVATKWQSALVHPGPRTLVVNGQEGEDETFKDRFLLQYHAPQVLEGALLAAWAFDATEIVFVVDPWFESGIDALTHAQSKLTSDSPAVRVVRGPGLYVAGEESALLEFLESKRAEPRKRPPYPTEAGLFGRPTVVHNVETVAWLPRIVEQGSQWYAANGRLKLVSLSGAVERPGVYAVRLGVTLQQIIDRAGGVKRGATLAGFGVGGPSGGLLPPAFAKVSLAAQDLEVCGAALGTASVRVLDGTTSILAAAGESIEFFRDESCGRCTPCRVGTAELARRWASLRCRGATEAEVDTIVELASTLRAASTCGLGSTAPNRLLTVLRHWPEEVAHGASRPHEEEGAA